MGTITITELEHESSAMLLARESTQALIDALWERGYQCVGPRVRDHAVVYEELHEAADLPWGMEAEQQAGRYRVHKTGTYKAFAWAAPAQSIKPWLFAPREVLWRVERSPGGGMYFEQSVPDARPLAVLGARACDLAALDLQDRHFLVEGRTDAAYAARRLNLFVVAANCTDAADTCFCASTEDGPQALQGYDIAFTEVEQGFLLHAASGPGRELLQLLPLSPVNEEILEKARAAIQAAAEQQRTMPSAPDLLALREHLGHARWDEVGARCLSCGNCTSVCPSCFCHRNFDSSELDDASARHGREWDSCFNEGHSYIHGLTVRASIAQRYRQWLTHKLANWQTQYGRSGCVGCGRCITWCPAAIDIVEEARAVLGVGDE